MNPISYIYTEVVYRPLLNSLVFIYTALPYHDLGLAIIVLTFIVRLILHPSMVQTIRSQQAMAKIQPRLKEVQERFKGNKEEQARQTMALYREHGIHPLSGCVPLLVQLPLLFGLYQVFWKGIQLKDRTLLYSFLPAIELFQPLAFGFFDLTAPSRTLAIAAGLSQFLQGKIMTKLDHGAGGSKNEFANMLKTQTTYFLPVIIVFFSWKLPSAIALYWTVLNLLAIVQQLFIQRRLEHERSTKLSSRDP